MANLIEIDLDNNLVIPTPIGEKDNLTNIVAAENGYSHTVITKENKEFLGTPTELDNFITTKPIEIRILNRLSDRVLYEEIITSQNPLTSLEYGRKVILDLIGDKVRADILSYNTKALQEQQKTVLETTEAQIKAGLDQSFSGIVAL